ncbi:ABC transporter F family member 4-like isoform X2 [Durio zibethinus]|uniref:ABC transporter F family member 4-like isoform X2 n=1 Tax=Durio zibethinus TaxID=66656 RepID=A0A6P5YDJ6_DURZI|nr:ABC transporter F family member 4-like isoform X2 [Durio zibethinus]
MKKMGVESVSESSLSKVKLSGSEKKKMKKQRKQHQAIENANAESKEKETSFGTNSKPNASLDSLLHEEEDSLRKDSYLETEQSNRSRRKRKRKENSLIDEKQSDSFVESSGLMEEANPLMKDMSVGSESGLKGSRLNEQPAHSERKRKRKKERKKGLQSVVELRYIEESSFMGENQSDSRAESELNVSLEPGLKEGSNSLMNDTLLERDWETLEKISLESSQLNEQPTDSERKRKKKERKKAKAGQFEKFNGKSGLELRDGKEISLTDEKQSGSHVESKVNVSLESGLKEGPNSDVQTLENVSLESGLKGIQLNEQRVQSERKRKRKREKRKKRRLSALEDNDIIAKRNNRDNNEAENNNMCPELQTTNGKDFRKEDLMSKNMKKRRSDSPRTASTSMVKAQDLHVDGNLVLPEIKDIKTLQIGETVKTYHRKRKKSSNLLGDSLEQLPKNGMIQTSIDHLEKEQTTGFSANGSDGVLVRHAMPAQALEEAFGNSTGSESALKGRKRKKRKTLKESLSKYPDQKDVQIETKMEQTIPSLSKLSPAKDDVALTANVKENNLSRTLYSSLERICISRPKKKLLVLDLNGILVDVVQNPGEFQPDIKVAGKGVFKRPFCGDFLNFCFRTFNVGIWSSRIYKNVNKLVTFLMRKWRHNLLFCWYHRS